MPFKDKAKSREASRKNYLKNPEWYKKRNELKKIDDREFIKSHKFDPCLDCGGYFPYFCMDFHHRDPSDKRTEIARLIGRGRNIIAKEIAKCDLLCANCHRIREYGHMLSSSNG